MEIIDYLRILRRRRLVLILVPVVAVGIAVGWALLKPPNYAGVATINGSALVGTSTSQFTGPQGVGQFVAAFDAAASGPAVLNAVSDTTQVPVKDLRSGLVVTQVGSSSTMRIAFDSEKRERVDPVLSAVVQESFAALFQPRADQAARDRDAAAAAVQTANDAAQKFSVDKKVAEPREAYQALVGKITSLEQQQAVLRANGNAVSAAALDSPLTTAREQAVAFGPLLAEFATVEAKQRAAADALVSAEQDYRLATGQLTAASSDRVVYLSGVSAAAAGNAAWGLVFPVLGAGIFVALVLVLVLELLERAQIQRRRETSNLDSDGPQSEGSVTAAMSPDVDGQGQAAVRPLSEDDDSQNDKSDDDRHEHSDSASPPGQSHPVFANGRHTAPERRQVSRRRSASTADLRDQ